MPYAVDAAPPVPASAKPLRSSTTSSDCTDTATPVVMAVERFRSKQYAPGWLIVRGDGAVRGRGPSCARAALREPRSRRLRPLLRGVGGERARAGGPRGRDEPAGDRTGPAAGAPLQRGAVALLRPRGAPVPGRTPRRPG